MATKIHHIHHGAGKLREAPQAEAQRLRGRREARRSAVPGSMIRCAFDHRKGGF